MRCVAIGLLFQDILNGLCIQQITDGVILTNSPFVFELLIGDSGQIFGDVKGHHGFYKFPNSFCLIAFHAFLYCTLCFQPFLFFGGQTTRTRKLVIKRFFLLLGRNQLGRQLLLLRLQGAASGRISREVGFFLFHQFGNLVVIFVSFFFSDIRITEFLYYIEGIVTT